MAVENVRDFKEQTQYGLERIRAAVERKDQIIARGTPIAEWDAAIDAIETGGGFPYTEFTGEATASFVKNDPGYGLHASNWSQDRSDFFIPTSIGNRVYSIDWTPDGKYLLAVGSIAPYFYMLDEQFNIVPLSGYEITTGARSVAVSPDGNMIAVGIANLVLILEIIGGVKRLITTLGIGGVTGDYANYLSFSTDNRMLMASISMAPFYMRWNISDERFTSATITSPPPYMSTQHAFSPDGRFWVASVNGSLFIYKLSGGVFTKLSYAFTGRGVAWHPSGQYLFSISGGAPYYLEAYEIVGETFTKILESDLPASDYINVLSISPDGNYVAAAVEGITQTAWFKFNLTGSIIKLPNAATNPASPASDIRFSPSGTHLALSLQSQAPGVLIHETNLTDQILPHMSLAFTGGLSASRTSFAGLGFVDNDAQTGQQVTMKVLFE